MRMAGSVVPGFVGEQPMREITLDPANYEWSDRQQDDDVLLPVVNTYKLDLARTVRVGRHTIEHRFTVYSTNPWPRIPGCRIITIHGLTEPTTDSEGATS